MKNLYRKIFLSVAVTFAVAAVSYLNAQQPVVSPAVAVEAAANRSLEIRLRSIELERIKKEADRDIVNERHPPKKFPEIKEDFEKMQTVNFDSLQTAILKDNPDYKIINKAAAEIRRRAARLKKSLFSENLSESATPAKPDSAKAPQIDLSKADLKQLSILLDNSIYRFVKSNLFQNGGVVNLSDSVKAQNELNQIIKVSTLIEDKSKILSN